jgi:DNA-binding MarR family transcriptional regulator
MIEEIQNNIKKEWKVEEVLLRRVPVKVLECLEENPKTITEIARVTGVTYAHLVKLVHFFSDNSLVDLKQEGRIVRVSLTQKGTEVVKLIKALKGKLKV